MEKSLFILITLLAALVGQSFIWLNFEYVDENMWAKQAFYIDTGDPHAFDMLAAYGHPGTVAVEIAIITHRLFGISYGAASEGALALLNACTIASCVIVCYWLRPKSAWYLAVAGLLIANPLFPYSTPPTSAVAPLIVLLFLITLFLYEHAKKITIPPLIFWGIAAGLSASTRADITGMVAIPFLFFLIPRIGLKKMMLIILTAALTFCLTNPFMWSSPLGHLNDLVAKGTLHYADFAPNHLSPSRLLLLSPFATFSIVLGLIFLFFYKKLPFTLPRPFLMLILGMTAGISIIFLTAQFQTPRYFYPLAFVWEVFLPLFLLELAGAMNGSMQKRIAQIVILTLIIGGQIALLLHLWLTPVLLFICC